MRFEATKEKTEENNNDEQGTWEENFGGNTDSKPRGPQAIAMDFTFVGKRGYMDASDANYLWNCNFNRGGILYIHLCKGKYHTLYIFVESSY